MSSRCSAKLRDAGLGTAMSHRILMVLSGIMRHAVLRGRLDRNPVQPVRVPLPKRARAIRPLPPGSVERLRRALLDSDDLERGLEFDLESVPRLCEQHGLTFAMPGD